MSRITHRTIYLCVSISALVAAVYYHRTVSAARRRAYVDGYVAALAERR